MSTDLEAARTGNQAAFARLVAPYERELRAHCYRMAGSLHEAEDLAQESLLRAWKGLSTFEGRSSLRTWLHRIATHVCLDQLERRSPRLLPWDLEPANGPMRGPTLEPMWLEPCPESFYVEGGGAAPDVRYGARESVALALLAALQRLPARQRAVLLLRDVLGYEASECAELLGMTVAAANSALQRARETLEKDARPAAPAAPDDANTLGLLQRYVQAWEQADVSALVALLHEEATLAMPPLPAWLRGAAAIAASLREMVLPPEAVGRFRLVLTRASGQPALAAYQQGDDGVHRAASLHLLDIRQGRIHGIVAFLDPTLLGLFGLPETADLR
jgi:RNA polymerase sigma-70 factor (ECF subfamily)